jgi:hypothetical protein
MGRFSRVLRLTNERGPLLPIATLLLAAVLGTGCGGDAETPSTASDDSGLMLPPGFKPVDLPVEKRKAIFAEAHITRALAVQEANEKMPMDEEHMPKGNAAFEKRMAEHKAIIDGILEKNLPALAERNKISMADLSKIEEEAIKLRWTPPEEPKLEEKEAETGKQASTAEEAKTVPHVK